MALRVHILLGKSKRVLAALVIGFLASQVVTLAVIVSLLAHGGSIIPPAKIAISGIKSCSKASSDPQWVYPLCCSTLLIYELMLIAFCLHHAIAHLERPLWTSIRSYTGSLTSIIVRQSLFYFTVAFFGILITAMSQTPALQSSAAFLIINSIADFVLLTMIGPWIVLDLRRQYEENIENNNLRVLNLTTLRFGDRSIEEG